jgi:uncharacterized protein (DUF2236 family)
MTIAGIPAHDIDGTPAAGRARGPQAGRRGSARQAPRRRQPGAEIRSERADQDGTDMTSGECGMFGSASATWHLMGEPILWVAGIRALYLQALDPRTMLGTWQNSALVHRHEAWARFLRATEFVRIRTYGSTPDVERAGRRCARSTPP